MQQIKTKVLIIGAGTGGYVAGIRCGQLGLDTVLVDGGDGLGGTCLNVGCIPSKAIIHAAGKFETVAKAAGGGTLGITAAKPAIDLKQTVAWKDGIVRKLNAGVAALLKKAKVKVIKGWAAFEDAKTCMVKTEDGDIRITAEHVILATGSESVELPFLPFGGDVISSTEALSLPEVPKKLVVVGDKRGRVSYGYGKANEVPPAVEKAIKKLGKGARVEVLIPAGLKELGT